MREKLNELARLEAAEMKLSIQTASASMRGRSLLEAYKQIEELQKRLEAAERERDEMVASLAARDAQQRREGAAEAYEEMRKQAVEVGKQSGLAAKFCKIFADECIEQSAQRIREGK